MIPAKIHYCWFGKAAMPDTARQCLQSWKEVLPGYEIIKWDESKLVMDCEFVSKSYRAGKWAFVSDYMRLQALYREGGIYLDTDMLLLKDIDGFRKYSCFLGFENHNQVNAAILGAEAGHPFLRSIMQVYRNMPFHVSKPVPIPVIISAELKTRGFNLMNQAQQINGVSLFPTEYFYPLPQERKHESYEPYLTDLSHTVHLWDYSWMNEFSYFWQGDYQAGLRKTWQTLSKSPVQPISYYKDVIYHLSRYLFHD